MYYVFNEILKNSIIFACFGINVSKDEAYKVFMQNAEDRGENEEEYLVFFGWLWIYKIYLS